MRILAVVAVALLLAGCQSGQSGTGAVVINYTGDTPVTTTVSVGGSGGVSSSGAPVGGSGGSGGTSGAGGAVILPRRPGRRVFKADWPNFKCFKEITGDVPPVDSTPADAIWGTTEYHNGTTDPLCMSPPTPLHDVYGGKLHLSAFGIGFPIITKQTFSRDGVISMQAKVTCTASNDPDKAWGGMVTYNGDIKGPWLDDPKAMEKRMQDTGEWFGTYFSFRDGHLCISIWSASTIQEEQRVKVDLNREYTCRHDYDHARASWQFWVIDDTGSIIMYLKSDPEAPLNRDPLQFENDPRLAFFLGDLDLSIGETDVFSDAPGAVEV